MRAVVQRVSEASVQVEDQVVSAMGNGVLIFLGITHEDTEEDSAWLVRKIVNLRIFNDAQGVMNRSLLEVNGEAMVVSQFTLYAATKKGNRPSYINAARPNVAQPLYLAFVKALEEALAKEVGTGVFGAQMQVNLVNDGPVTILMDTNSKE
ncbi:D-aminoacyl-tRNA deacylase [Maribacter sp. 2307ULW6-5]|uniref:D-aminoacyl-tRNA deacylase n=1 Tax=Maribacter sp. 2307ULW6-5 TaxID=3386275 RepID=UPI0039BD793D